MIDGPDSRRVAIGGSHLFEPTILGVGFCMAWVGIVFAKWTLGAGQLIVEGDSATVVI